MTLRLLFLHPITISGLVAPRRGIRNFEIMVRSPFVVMRACRQQQKRFRQWNGSASLREAMVRYVRNARALKGLGTELILRSVLAPRRA